MLMVCLPTGEQSGTCMINGEKKDFKLTTADGKRYFGFRPAGKDVQWDFREVVTALPASKGLTTYYCGDYDGIPIVVMTAVVDDQGNVGIASIKEDTDQ
jgi:hypothetical protein